MIIVVCNLLFLLFCSLFVSYVHFGSCLQEGQFTIFYVKMYLFLLLSDFWQK